MIMGVYDRLISSIAPFSRKPAGSMAFLFKFVLGAGTGMVLFSRLLSAICSQPGPMFRPVFLPGSGGGGVPMIYREAGVKKLDLGRLPTLL